MKHGPSVGRIQIRTLSSSIDRESDYSHFCDELTQSIFLKVRHVTLVMRPLRKQLAQTSTLVCFRWPEPMSISITSEL
jgi:hypothetical protein